MIRWRAMVSKGVAVRRWPAIGTLALFFFVLDCRGSSEPAFLQLGESRRLAADLRGQLAKASDASDRAVMADTDEASVEFAREAARAIDSVDGDAVELAARLKNLRRAADGRILDEFVRRFAEYRKVDRDVLGLAVENTNLKAQRLSFGPVREAADAFSDSLRAISTAAAPGDRWRTEALAAQGALAVREIQVFQAAHIAEPDDAAMGRLEDQMATRQEEARDASRALTRGAAPAAAASVAAATAALARFEALSQQLVALSRRNSNVRSLALSLGRKPTLTAACDAKLAELEDALLNAALGSAQQGSAE
jgi:hypothetical protein